MLKIIEQERIFQKLSKMNTGSVRSPLCITLGITSVTVAKCFKSWPKLVNHRAQWSLTEIGLIQTFQICLLLHSANIYRVCTLCQTYRLCEQCHSEHKLQFSVLGACSPVDMCEKDGLTNMSFGPWLALGFDLHLQLLYVLLFPLLLIWNKKSY